MRVGRSSAAIPEVEVRPETRLEPEIENRTEIEVFGSTISEGGIWEPLDQLPLKTRQK